jgi:hypothetical protein
VNGESVSIRPFPGPGYPKHKRPSANPRALCSFQYATQDTLGSAHALCAGHRKGPVNAFAEEFLNVSQAIHLSTAPRKLLR